MRCSSQVQAAGKACVCTCAPSVSGVWMTHHPYEQLREKLFHLLKLTGQSKNLRYIIKVTAKYSVSQYLEG